ncbi:glycosyltransferase family 4 protein [Flavobacterium hungaricum]|uniref:Glycosyltransferase n=1 Tax=Flavobacterium hungaricum TaxID=2082725 RepID=A0ABR9TSY0_9FLAO|nr:glycosyltransferase family 4 protein [Flavobacterium hungaricum]MBE8727762.1 glycosyltransferase [Flavobacterium hungaricum]
MKKIIFVTPQFKNGGGNRVFVELSNSISRFGTHKLEIVYPNNSAEINHYKIEADIEIKVIGKLAANMYKKLFNCYLLFKYIINVLKSSDVTIIISDPILSVFLWTIPRKYQNNIVRFIQADDYRIYDDLFVLKNRLFLSIFKLLTLLNYKLKLKYAFNSSFTYKKFVEVSKQRDVRKVIIHPAVDKKIFNNLQREKKEIDDKLSISLIARDHPLKKLDDFLEMWSNLPDKTKSRISDVFLISTDKLERFDLNEFTIIRPQDDYEIANTFKKSDIFISTSLWEGFSLPPLEALHCGMVILSSDSGGVREYAFNTFNASLFEPGNIKELKDGLIELIDNNDKREKYIENGKKTVKEFSWDKSAKELIALVQS